MFLRKHQMETLVTFRNYVDFLRHVNIVFIVVHVLSIAITLLRRLILVSRLVYCILVLNLVIILEAVIYFLNDLENDAKLGMGQPNRR